MPAALGKVRVPLYPGRRFVKRPAGICHRARELRRLKLRPRHAVLVKTGGLLQPRVFAGRAAVRPGQALRVQDADRFLQLIAHHANRGHQVGIPGHHDRALVVAAEAVEQQIRRG